jgi:hypothetical protein
MDRKGRSSRSRHISEVCSRLDPRRRPPAGRHRRSCGSRCTARGQAVRRRPCGPSARRWGRRARTEGLRRHGIRPQRIRVACPRRSERRYTPLRARPDPSGAHRQTCNTGNLRSGRYRQPIAAWPQYVSLSASLRLFEAAHPGPGPAPWRRESMARLARGRRQGRGAGRPAPQPPATPARPGACPATASPGRPQAGHVTLNCPGLHHQRTA